MANKIDIDQLNIVLDAEDLASSKIQEVINKLNALNQVAKGNSAGNAFDGMAKGADKAAKNAKKAGEESDKANKKARDFNETEKKGGGKGAQKTADATKEAGKRMDEAKKKAESLQETLKFARSLKETEQLQKKLEGLVKTLNDLRTSGKNDPIREGNLSKQIQDTEKQLINKGGTFEGMTGMQKMLSFLNGIGEKTDQVVGKVKTIGTAFSRAATPVKVLFIVIKGIQAALKVGIEIVKKIVKIITTVVTTLTKIITGITKSLATAAKYAMKLASIPFKPIINGLKSVHKRIGAVIGQIARMVKMRLYRLIAKYIVSGLFEGLQNAYHWAKEFDNKFAGSMDSLATSALYLKNSLGAMAMPIVNRLSPAIDYLVDKFVDLLNVINQVIARLTGQSSWTKAVKVPKAYADNMADAAGSARDLNKELITILGIDEINPLNGEDDNSRGRGSGAADGIDYSSMFEEVKQFDTYSTRIADMIKEAWAKADFTEIGRLVATKVNTALNSINWDSIKATATKVGSSLATFLNGLFLTPTDGNYLASNISTTIAEAINTAFTAVLSFADKFEWGRIGASIGRGIADGLGKIDWATIKAAAATLGKGIADAIKNAVTAKNKNGDTMFSGLGKAIGEGINTVVIGLKNLLNSDTLASLGSELAKGFKEAIKTIKWTGEDGIGSLISTGINSAFRGIKNFVSGMRNSGLAEKIASAINEIIAETNWEDVGSAIHDGIKAALEFLRTLIGEVDWDAFALAMQDLFSGIDIADLLSTALATALEAAGGFGKVVAGILKGITGFSPEKEENYKNAITSTMQSTDGSMQMDEFGNVIDITYNAKYGQGSKEILDEIQEAGKNKNPKFQTEIDKESKYTVDQINNVNGKKTAKLNVKQNNSSKKNAESYKELKNKTVVSKINGKIEDTFKTLKKEYVGVKDKSVWSKANGKIDTSFKTLKDEYLQVKDNTALKTIESKYGNKSVWDENKKTYYDFKDNKAIKSIVSEFLNKSVWNSNKSTFDAFADAKAIKKISNAFENKKTWDANKDEFKSIASSTITKTLKNAFDAWKEWVKNKDEYNSLKSKTVTNTIKWDAKATSAYNTAVRNYNTAVGNKNANSKMWMLEQKRGGAFYNGGWHDIPQYAGGGIPSHGSHFIAGEAGAELVGHIGGRTEVLNQSQLASTMYSSVASANASQNRLLQEQNNLLRELISKQGSGRGFTASDVIDGFTQMNKRDGRTIVGVGV